MIEYGFCYGKISRTAWWGGRKRDFVQQVRPKMGKTGSLNPTPMQSRKSISHKDLGWIFLDSLRIKAGELLPATFLLGDAYYSYGACRPQSSTTKNEELIWVLGWHKKWALGAAGFRNTHRQAANREIRQPRLSLQIRLETTPRKTQAVAANR